MHNRFVCFFSNAILTEESPRLRWGSLCAKEVIEERGGELREVYVFARFRQCEHEERLLQATPAGLRAQLDCRPMSKE